MVGLMIVILIVLGFLVIGGGPLPGREARPPSWVPDELRELYRHKRSGRSERKRS